MEDGERKIQGYLECDGSIVRISSLEDIKNFITKYGKTVNEISDLELKELTNRDHDAKNRITDDCDITSKNDPLVLFSKTYGLEIENYKIKERTVDLATKLFRCSDKEVPLKNVLIPDSVIAIGDYAFFNCNIGQLKFPDSLKHIGTLAFYWNKIKSISFPKNMAHPTFRVMRQSCSAYSLSLKYLSSLKPYALRFITFILLFIPSTLAVEI